MKKAMLCILLACASISLVSCYSTNKPGQIRGPHGVPIPEEEILPDNRQQEIADSFQIELSYNYGSDVQPLVENDNLLVVNVGFETVYTFEKNTFAQAVTTTSDQIMRNLVNDMRKEQVPFQLRRVKTDNKLRWVFSWDDVPYMPIVNGE